MNKWKFGFLLLKIMFGAVGMLCILDLMLGSSLLSFFGIILSGLAVLLVQIREDNRKGTKVT